MEILSVSGDNYVEILHDTAVPQLRTKANFDKLYLQQDGTPPHYARTVREYLQQAVRQRWFGGRGSIEWPPRSPDLTPLDFFFGVQSRTRFIREIPTQLMN